MQIESTAVIAPDPGKLVLFRQENGGSTAAGENGGKKIDETSKGKKAFGGSAGFGNVRWTDSLRRPV